MASRQTRPPLIQPASRPKWLDSFERSPEKSITAIWGNESAVAQHTHLGRLQ
jgi:hypothetical protein